LQVSGLTGVTAIAVGWRHTVALKNDGTVWAWGLNGYGELGDGTYTNRPTPVQVSGLTGVLAIGAGGFHSLAILPTVADVTAPTGSVFINTGSAYTNTSAVTLDLFCSDTGQGCAEMVFSNDGVTWSSPADVYARTKSWTLDTTGGSGTKTVYVKFKDYADNWSEAVSDAISLDTAYPVTTATASGYTFDTWTNSGTVNVTLSVSDASSSGLEAGYPKYCIDTTNTCMPLTSYTSGFNVSCVSGTTCTQYVRYYARNNAFNTEDIKSSVVKQDGKAPTDGTLTATPGSPQVALNWTGFTDAGSEITGAKVVYSTSGFPATCMTGTVLYEGPYITTYTHTGVAAGTTYYRVCAIDGAGNMSAGATASATVQPAPEGSIPIGVQLACPASVKVGQPLTVTVNLYNWDCYDSLSINRFMMIVMGNANGTLSGLGIFGPYNRSLSTPKVVPPAVCGSTTTPGTVTPFNLTAMNTVPASLSGKMATITFEAITDKGQTFGGGECMVNVVP